jgi:translocator assembly and maintenance protein 41
MIDLVFAVDDAEAWHKENLTRNPHHYSFLRCACVASVGDWYA